VNRMNICKSSLVLLALALLSHVAYSRDLTTSDDQAIAATVTRLLFAVDKLDWPGVRAEFADEVETDYTSLFGGTPERMKADTLVQRWRSLLPGFDATQHLTGPVIVTSRKERTAVAETHVRGYHYIESESPSVWMAAGHYVMRMEHTAAGWKIASIRLDTYRQEGNRNFPAIATQRAKENSGRSR
jgi:hypothetical protein